MNIQNEKIENMTEVVEHLTMLLHNEWERSGKTRVTVRIGADEIERVKETVKNYIYIFKERADNESCTFSQNMRMSHDAFILIRLAKKINKQEERAIKKGGIGELNVELDKEEYKFFKKITADLEE